MGTRKSSRDFMHDDPIYDDIPYIYEGYYDTNYFLWLFDIKKYFYFYNIREENKVQLIVDKLVGYAVESWTRMEYVRSCNGMRNIFFLERYEKYVDF